MDKAYNPYGCAYTHNIFTRNGKHAEERGITLIALIITVIVMLILAGVTISAITGGLFGKVNEAKVRYDLSVIQEEITTYALGQQMDQKSGIDMYPVLSESGNYITMNDIADKSTLPERLKARLLLLANTAKSGEIPTYDDIDYTQFYKIDSTKVQSAAGYGDLYLYQDSTGYKVISLSGLTLSSALAYIVIPWNDMGEPQYIATDSNTYKLYGDGTLKVVGQINSNSSKDWEEIDSFVGLKEFIMPSEIPTDQTTVPYFSSGTAYVIDTQNRLWAWGDNYLNKLGLGNSYLVTKPTVIRSNVKKVWAERANTYVVDLDGNLYGAGSNQNGQLGQGNTDVYTSFVPINWTAGEIKDMLVAELRSHNSM